MNKSDELSLLIVEDDGCNVWISLPQHHPIDDPYGFIIGCGDTRDKAVADAVAALENAIERLQAPIGVVPEKIYK